MEWSPDGSHILAALNKRSQIIVKSVHDNEWEAKIEEVRLRSYRDSEVFPMRAGVQTQDTL